MNDSGHERETKKRKISEGSWKHVGPSCVHKDDLTLLVLGQHPT